MEVTLSSTRPADVPCDLLVVVRDGTRVCRDAMAVLDAALSGRLGRWLRQRRAALSKTTGALYPCDDSAIRARNIMVIQAPPPAPMDWRLVAERVVSTARDIGARSASIVTGDDSCLRILGEALELSAYEFRGLKSPKPSDQCRLDRAALLCAATPAQREALRRGLICARATNLARDLVNQPANVVTPRHLASVAAAIARRQRLSLRVFDERAMSRLGMGATIAVARGSAEPPRFVELIYKPGTRPRRPAVALVGKGITFDSGGLALKSAESIQVQKRDMAGAAVVLGVMSAIRDLSPGVEVRGYIAAAENMPGGSATRPGDVVRAYNGTTIEVLNTDAEGRLVLADALAFAAKAQPTCLIDFATLTAAVGTALGSRYAALMTTGAELGRRLREAAAAAGENLWELPLVDDYRKDLDSAVADMKNTGEGQAGTIIGGLFLREFAGGLPWAHIDFSSTAVVDKPFPGHPKGASGFGVRTALSFLTAMTAAPAV